jgi:aromatic-L-amino-acid decarboxylase
MNWTEFARWGRRMADWTQDYHLNRARPTRARADAAPVRSSNALPAGPPDGPEDLEQVFRDFETS